METPEAGWVGRFPFGVQPFPLQTGDALLIEFIRETIAARGPVPFAWFMEQALYHPAHGYYASGRAAIGRHGDYYTSVSVGPLFGRLLAAQFAEMWQALGRPNEFTIVEQGAHEGAFARDVLKAAQRHHPEFFETLHYAIVELFPVLQERQRETLASVCDKVRWHSLLAELAPFRGVHFSNELIDSLPVHLLRWNGAGWLERHVDVRGDEFVFVDLPLSEPALAEDLRSIPAPSARSYETEVNLRAPTWLADVSAKLSKGFILAVDYGFPRTEFYAPHRTAGTLRGFSHHQVIASPLTEVGRADITAHVQWTSLAERAEMLGLQIAGFADQHHFITGLLAGDLGAEFGPDGDAKTRRALQTLLHPNFLGMNFQLLALSKNLESQPTLAGFRFAGDFRAALGLVAPAGR
ncbi:MAG: class I SAM-dependent methyltransferase [Chthoniobacterales bacterium]